MERYWYIGYKNDIKVCYNHKGPYVDTDVTKQRELIGNRFESFEDAEKSLEKLKAWKRLKDKGFSMAGCFDTDEVEDGEVLVMTNGYISHIDDDILADLEKVFGDKE